MDEGVGGETKAGDDERNCGPGVPVKLCSFEEEERQENDDQAKRGTAAFQLEVGRWQGVERKE